MKPKFSYKEIVRLTVAGGYTQPEIAAAANCAAGTVSNVQKRLRSSGIDGDTALSIQIQILMLRNVRFFSADEAGQTVAEKLDELNARPFKKHSGGSHTEVFLAKERHMLAPLPAT